VTSTLNSAFFFAACGFDYRCAKFAYASTLTPAAEVNMVPSQRIGLRHEEGERVGAYPPSGCLQLESSFLLAALRGSNGDEMLAVGTIANESSKSTVMIKGGVWRPVVTRPFEPVPPEMLEEIEFQIHMAGRYYLENLADAQPAIEAAWALVRQFNSSVTGEDE
jgi:hypothetical protein